jgi:hypothetical protein
VFGAGTATLLNALRWAVLSDFAFLGEQPYISKRRARFSASGLTPINQRLTGILPIISAMTPAACCLGSEHVVA